VPDQHLEARKTPRIN